MKKMKKIFAMLIAMVMVLGMSMSVFANTYDQNYHDGTITISNATIGSTYTLYKVFNATVGENGEVAYSTLDGKQLAANAYFTSDAKGNITATTIEENVQDTGLNTWIEANGQKVGSSVTATAQTVKFESLTPGYYYVKTTTNGGAKVTITPVTPTAIIIDKNLVPSFEDDAKEIVKIDGDDTDIQSAQYGSTVSYKVTATATNYDGDQKVLNYKLSDTKAAGLTYDKNSVKVYVDAQGTATVPTTEISNYTLTWGANDASFEILIPWYENDAFNYNAVCTITVTYDAIVNNEAALAGTGNQNTAKFTYEKEKDGWTTEEESSTEVYTFALAILKTNETGEPLKDAEFEIADAAGNKLTFAAATNGVYNFDSKETNTTAVTPANGIIIVKGVKAGTYTVTETVAPDGYKLLTNPATVDAQVASAASYTTKITTYYDADGKVVEREVEGGSSKETTVDYNVSSITVVNTEGTTLPSTGGMGTTIFYALGAVLVICAGVILATRRRNAQ